MAVCCILIAILMAQITATMRRWGIFWGVVRAEAGEDADTMLRRVRQWLARPRVRQAVFAVMAFEAVAVGSWVYDAHGGHFYRLGDEAIGKITGHRVIYAQVCTPDGSDRYVRMALALEGQAQPRSNPLPLS